MTFERLCTRSYLRASISIALLSTLALAQAHAAPGYQLSTIGSTLQLPFMNTSGTVAGISQGQLAVFQDGNTRLVDLPAGTTFSYASGINDQGVILGGAYRETLVGGTIEHAGHVVTDNQQQFLYQNGKLTNMQQIIGLPLVAMEPGPMASVRGLNNHGELVGTISHTNSAASEAFAYRNGQLQTIATPGNWSSVNAHAINNLGVVVGSYSFLNPGDSQFTTGVFLDDHGKLTDLGAPGSGAAFIRGFNDKGQILVESGMGTSIYENGRFTALNVQSGSPESFFSAKGLSTDGVVIGTGLSDTWSSVPILFANGEKLDPNSLIDPESAAQHHITQLLSINSKGVILAVDQAGQQVLLTPLSAVPETGSLSLMVSGLALMALLRQRRQIKHTEH